MTVDRLRPNCVTPPLLLVSMRSLYKGLKLTPATLEDGENIWTRAITRQLRQMTLINNVTKDGIFNKLTRQYGWMSLDFLLYGARNMGRLPISV